MNRKTTSHEIPPNNPPERRPLRWRVLGLIAVAVLAAVVAVSCATQGFWREQPATTPGAEFVGSKACMECHEDVIESFAHTRHGPLYRVNDRLCESCHGPGSIHVQKGEGFIVMPNDASCLACHMDSGSHSRTEKRTLMDWQFADHRRAGVKCIDCHSPHSHGAGVLREDKQFQIQHTDSTSALCLSCHQEIAGRISMPYHHPIREGAMGCTDCHDPHGRQSRQLLNRNETCFKCHQAQQGPFSREHQPVAENCTICHDPHGSPVVGMTKVGQPMLCLQCHPLTMNRHQNIGQNVSPAALRNCTSCHAAIHGSDIEPYFRH
jgi:DmsE family decaheme c-type cytochrome